MLALENVNGYPLCLRAEPLKVNMSVLMIKKSSSGPLAVHTPLWISVMFSAFQGLFCNELFSLTFLVSQLFLNLLLLTFLST